MSSLATIGQARDRLEQLYEISKLFVRFQDVESTFDAALAVTSKALPLRSAIVIDEAEGQGRMVVWPSGDQTSEEIATAKMHAQSVYGYFVGPSSGVLLALQERAGKTPLARRAAATDTRSEKKFIVIPLTVGRGPVFGALQLESAGAIDKSDLIFVNAIANQLAVALDRHAERHQAEEALQRAVRTREHVLEIVAHDLRNPLNAIQICASALLTEAPPPTLTQDRREKQRSRIEIIDRSARRMGRLINDLLDFASIQAERLEWKKQVHRLEPLVQEALTSFESVAREKRLTFRSEIASDLSVIDCDRDRVLQVLGNLIGNAMQATEMGSVVLGAEGRGDEVLFSVTDTGPGIPKEELDQIFERYRRGKNAGYGGTGLGLAIAKGIVVAHGGAIWAESTVGTGSTFFFTIPAAVAPPEGPRVKSISERL